MWEKIRNAPQPWNALVQFDWGFEQVEGRTRARMYLDKPVEDLRNESSWPEVFQWFGEKLSLVYGLIAPKLREEMEQIQSAE